MGLDMYLYLRKYESACSWEKDYAEKRGSFYPSELKSFADEIDKHNFMSKETSFQIGYWRKANAIHSWFVKNCADGVDECQKIYVDESKLKELLGNVEEILEAKEEGEKDISEKAKALLPTQSGFFFGGTDYDEWYFEDLKYTKGLLKNVLGFLESKEGAKYDIIYQASW